MTKLNALLLTLIVGSTSVAVADPIIITTRESPDYRDRRPDHRHPSRHRHQRITLSGSFTSEFGPVELRQDGNRISGSFAAGGGGEIDGQIVGDQVRFRWWNAKERGRGVWYMKNPNRIVGTWGKRRSTSNGGQWNLRRL